MFGFGSRKKDNAPVDSTAPATAGDLVALRREIDEALNNAGTTLKGQAKRIAVLESENAALLALVAKLDSRSLDSNAEAEHAEVRRLLAARPRKVAASEPEPQPEA